MTAPHPLQYPSDLTRKHGPSGYADHASYRPWIRDEFKFRCCYCLSRETWRRNASEFDLEHRAPRSARSDLALSYENLVYSCHSCNISKGTRSLEVPTMTSLVVSSDGAISALTTEGQRVIELLSLDDVESTNFRRTVLGIVRSTYGVPSEAETFTLYMGFPRDNLPDLSRLRCPANSRPEGVGNSWHALHQRGELPDFYE